MAPARVQPGEVRLIGGAWKRSRVPVLAWPGLRPTPDRVRETLFNWLGQDLSGWRVLDAFAGSGALGLEAASRGAARVLLLERQPELAHSLRQVIERLGGSDRVSVQAVEALSWMASAPPGGQDLVLLDPPFEADLFGRALAAAVRLVAPGGWIYLEADRAFSEPDLAPLGLALHRSGRAGAVHHHLLKRIDPVEPAT